MPLLFFAALYTITSLSPQEQHENANINQTDVRLSGLYSSARDT